MFDEASSPPSDANSNAASGGASGQGADGEQVQVVQVTKQQAGQRLDRMLGQHCSLSRSQARRLLRQGQVQVNGRTVDESHKGVILQWGDELRMNGPLASSNLLPVTEPDFPLTMVGEGGDWLAVDKPAGVAVHPLEPGETGTLLNAVAAWYPQILHVGEGGLRSGVVHRLDVATSGVVLFALSDERFEQLRKAFSKHTIRKTYLAAVAGRLEGEGQEDLFLVVAKHRPATVRAVSDEQAPHLAGSRRCSLAWRSLEAGDTATLVEVDLHTGFLHQIRATFQHLDHPVLGDDRYPPSDDRPLPAAPRLMLHAHHIAVDDIEATSPMPDVFKQMFSNVTDVSGR